MLGTLAPVIIVCGSAKQQATSDVFVTEETFHDILDIQDSPLFSWRYMLLPEQNVCLVSSFRPAPVDLARNECMWEHFIKQNLRLDEPCRTDHPGSLRTMRTKTEPILLSTRRMACTETRCQAPNGNRRLASRTVRSKGRMRATNC